MSSFRTFVWDPTLLVSQMLCIQTIFYTVEAACMLAYSNMSTYDPTLAHVFSMQTMRIMVVAQLMGSVACAFALAAVVQRAKQCLDFACTVHVFLFVFVVIYNRSIPTHLLWWVLQIASAIICTVLGEYLCMRAETKEIKLGAPSKYDL